jgi:SAM-dependent methyltransferase
MTTFAGAEYWNSYFRQLQESGRDLDWQGRWVEPFWAALRAAHTHTILELGCGTGHDAARLTEQGYVVTAIDVSGQAIERARTRFGSRVHFLVADMAVPLPFPELSFDAVMSNVALHMFPDRVTRRVFAEIGRVIRPGGLFVFHVNALEDRPLRQRRWPGTQELEDSYVLEPSGQTMHFFSEDFLRELLAQWREVRLELVEITDPETGAWFKRVWRGIARR